MHHEEPSLNTLSLVAKHLIAWALMSILVGCGSLRPPIADGRQTLLTTRIDALFAQKQADTSPGLAILIVKDGQPIYWRSKGLADIEHGLPITENTPFELASVSKPITALAIMQLKERGRLALTDSVLKWLPELPASWGNITLHHLLSHQAGVPDYYGLNRAKTLLLDGMTNRDLIQRYAEQGTLNFQPGTHVQYSNGNYVILAEVLSRVSGQTYGQYIREQIFTPLGMNSSSVFGEPPAGTEAAALNFGRSNKLFFGITLATVGSIGITSTAADMQRFVKGLLAGKIVSQASLALMTTPKSAKSEHGIYYGYGWYVLPDGPPLGLFAHSGDEDGFHSYLRINNLTGIYYVMLSNGGDATKKLMVEAYKVAQPLYE
jgi:D-alanyl-D-alanine carboxypeptidase